MCRINPRLWLGGMTQYSLFYRHVTLAQSIDLHTLTTQYCANDWHLSLIYPCCQVRTCEALFPKVDSSQLPQAYHCVSIPLRRAVIVE